MVHHILGCLEGVLELVLPLFLHCVPEGDRDLDAFDMLFLKSGVEAFDDGLGMEGIGLRQQEDEFITPDAADDVVLAAGFAHHLGNLAQQLVPGLMAEGVIGQLQAVHICNDQGKGVVGF